MAFINLKTDDKRDYLCSTANIASIQYDEEIYLELQKGPRLLGRPGEMNLQDTFRISAGKEDVAAAATELAAEITAAEKSGATIDLRERVILSQQRNWGMRG
jgi:hypothetical protein